MNYLKYLVEEIHTTIAATVDNVGLPVTSAIEMMDYDEDGLYFLTARGEGFYQRLVNRGYMSLTGIKGEGTLNSVALSVRGSVQELGGDLVNRLLEKNSYMTEIYPTKCSRSALTVFKLFDSSGEWFDLSKNPIERATFTFGGSKEQKSGYYITDICISCGKCAEICPQSCIKASRPYFIQQENCLRCGGCVNVCPAGAVKKWS